MPKLTKTKDGRTYIAPQNRREAQRKYDWDKLDVIPLNDAPYQIQNIVLNGHLHNTARMNVVSYLLGNGFAPGHIREVIQTVRWAKPVDSAAIASIDNMLTNRTNPNGWAAKGKYWDEHFKTYKPLIEKQG